MEDTKTKYIDTKKLIALLEQRKKQLVQWTDKEYANQRIDEIDCILDVDIDSLQQEQPIQVNTLTWKDIVDLERIINNVHYEFRYGIGQKSFGDEVLDRFRAERDEQEQPEVDLEKEIIIQWSKCNPTDEGMGSEYAIIGVEQFDAIVRHFYKLGRKQVLQEIYDGKTKPVDKIIAAWFDDKGEESK